MNSTNLILSDHLLIECQTDLFQLLDQQQINSSLMLNERRWHLQLFIGYYTFIHHHIDFLFDMEVFTEKLFRFILNSIDFNLLIQSNLNLLNGTSLPNVNFDKNQYDSIYKNFKSDVHDEIEQIIRLFMKSHKKFYDYLIEQINQKKIINENNQKIFYLLSILSEQIHFEDYQMILSLLTQLISDENENKNRQQIRKRKKDRIKKGNALR